MGHFRSIVVLIALGFIWGSTVPLTKIAVATGHQPLGLIFWQLVIVASALSLISLARRVGPLLTRRTLSYFVVIALLGAVVPNSFSYLAAVHLPAGILGIVIASVPIFSLGIALGLGLERATLSRGLGVLLGLAAVILLLAPQSSLPEPEKAVFVLVALIAPLCYGAEGNFVASRAPPNMDPVVTLLGASSVGIVIAGPLAVLTGSWVDPFIPWRSSEWALLASSLCHVVAYTGYIWLVGISGAVFASQVSYVVTVTAVFLSSLILNESYSAWVWSALVLMIAGLALVQPRGSGQPTSRSWRE
jgi:drug/metabolite transporter (DMT)-like permease